MYLHLGQSVVVNENEIIGIFDLDNTSQSHITREYLTQSEKAGRVINVSEEIPKSFILCDNGTKERLFISQLAPATLLKRFESKKGFALLDE